MLCDRLVYLFKEILRLPTLSVEFCDGQIAVLGLIDMSQSGTLNNFIPREYSLEESDTLRHVNAAETDLVGELGKVHYQEQITAFESDDISVAIVSLYALVELISRYERHDLSECCLSQIHYICLLQYALQKYKIKSRKNNILVTHRQQLI